MNKLLEILCNPNERIPLETLIKCEKALERMDIKSYGPPAKETTNNNPLLEAVTANLQSPIRNHTLQRTFKPCLDAMFGNDLAYPPAKRLCQDPQSQQHHHHHFHHQQQLQQQQQQQSGADRAGSAGTGATGSGSAVLEIPHILQGEIARLDQKFKINLDGTGQVVETKTIKLICCLDDKYLPCVPPVSILIPEEYPMVSPTCHLTDQEYDATPFLKLVQQSFVARLDKLPLLFSLTHLLDTWEMSVRQACSPNGAAAHKPSQLSVLLGI